MPAFVSDRDLPTIEAIINDYRAGKLQNKPERPGGDKGRKIAPKLAKVVTAEIPAEGSGKVQLQTPAWESNGSEPIDAVNEFPVALPVDTKLYVQTFAGSCRILVPFLTCPEP